MPRPPKVACLASFFACSASAAAFFAAFAVASFAFFAAAAAFACAAFPSPAFDPFRIASPRAAAAASLLAIPFSRRGVWKVDAISRLRNVRYAFSATSCSKRSFSLSERAFLRYGNPLSIRASCGRCQKHSVMSSYLSRGEGERGERCGAARV